MISNETQFDTINFIYISRLKQSLKIIEKIAKINPKGMKNDIRNRKLIVILWE